MTPFYEQDGITIYHGDCREILPEIGRVDCVVTSPPYNTLPTKHNPSGLHGERKSGVNQWIERATKGYADAMPEEEYQEWLRGIVKQCLEICDGLVWVNGGILRFGISNEGM
jgi:DNA modification methylase